MIKVCFVEKPVILCAPEPRSLELIFTVENLKVLQAGYQLIEVEQDDIANLSPDILAQVSYIICIFQTCPALLCWLKSFV